MIEVKGLKIICVYDTVYRIQTTCRMKLDIFFYKATPCYVLLEIKCLNISYSSDHKKVYVFYYAIAVARFDRYRSRPCRYLAD